MKISTFKQLIREEIRKVIAEARYVEKPSFGFYLYLSGKYAIQGDSINSISEIVSETDVDKVAGPVYILKLGKYTVYVITDKTNKRDFYCIVTPFDKELADKETANKDIIGPGKSKGDVYDICMKAIKSIKPGTTKEITFKELLKK